MLSENSCHILAEVIALNAKTIPPALRAMATEAGPKLSSIIGRLDEVEKKRIALFVELLDALRASLGNDHATLAAWDYLIQQTETMASGGDDNKRVHLEILKNTMEHELRRLNEPDI